jgi:hypothetical protein
MELKYCDYVNILSEHYKIEIAEYIDLQHLLDRIEEELHRDLSLGS